MSQGTVLIIEADEGVARRLSESLTAKGYAVEVALEARAGFEAACASNPDCIVCNIELPDIDGFWVARRIRTESGSVSSTPFLLLSESDDVDALLRGLHVGSDVYLSITLTR